MFSPEMPPLVDIPDNTPTFIPPPLGASNGGQPGVYDAFPGAREGNNQPGSNAYWPSTYPQGTPYPPFQAPLPNWPPSLLDAPPNSAQSWTFGQYPPAGTPVWGPPQLTPWASAAPTPAGTWGAPSPASHGFPRTPIIGQAGYTPWTQPQQQLGQQQPAYIPPASAPAVSYNSGFGQPISAGWFGNGSGGLGNGGYSPFHNDNDEFSRQPKRRNSIHQNPSPGMPYDPGFGQQITAGWGNGGGYSPFHNDDEFPPKPKRKNSAHRDPSLKRAKSQHSSPRRPPLQRSASFGHNGLGYEYPGYAQGDVFNADNLARRPRDWRPDYFVRGGLTSYIPRVGKSRSDVKEYSDPERRALHPLLLHSPSRPPVYYNLHSSSLKPMDVQFLNLNRRHNEIDFAQLALQPSCSFMRLYHPKLPWYIDVYQTHPNGVTVWDVIATIHRQLHHPISGRHYWTDELADVDRAAINEAFKDRCRGDPNLVMEGVVQVDYIGKKAAFEGLSRGPKGLWEIKTSRL